MGSRGELELVVPVAGADAVLRARRGLQRGQPLCSVPASFGQSRVQLPFRNFEE